MPDKGRGYVSDYRYLAPISTVTVQPQSELPAGMQCMNKFMIQTVLVAPPVDLTCISKKVFDKDGGYLMKEYKLPVVYLSTALPLAQFNKDDQYFIEEYKQPEVYQPADVPLPQMSALELLTVEPKELKFPFEVNKRISTSLQLSNMTKNYVAFKVKTTHVKKYCVRPNRGVMNPQSSRIDITVTMQAQKAPPDTQCKEKFLVQTAVVNPGATEKDINWQTFGTEGLVKEFKMRVVYTFAPEATSPAAEVSEACSSKTANLMQNESPNIPQEPPRSGPERNLRGISSIFGMIADVFSRTMRSHHGYKMLRLKDDYQRDDGCWED